MSATTSHQNGFDVAIKEVSVTEERQPFVPAEGDVRLKHPGVARANIAVSVEAPNGTQQDGWAQRYRHRTVLQQHCTFWDTDEDGIIWPQDTFTGFRRLGYNLLVSITAVLVIHLNFSWPTVSGYLPDPLLRIYLSRVHKDKHGSDSGTFDNEGRFVPQEFEDIFSKYAGGDRQGLTLYELSTYIKGQRYVMDPIGWCGAIFEWGITYILLWPEDGRIMKEDIRRIYDGSIFFEIAARREKNI